MAPTMQMTCQAFIAPNSRGMVPQTTLHACRNIQGKSDTLTIFGGWQRIEAGRRSGSPSEAGAADMADRAPARGARRGAGRYGYAVGHEVAASMTQSVECNGSLAQDWSWTSSKPI